MRANLISLFVLASSAAAHATPLTLEYKMQFTTTTKDSCLGVQARDPGNKTLTVAAIQDYCGCYADGAAAGMQMEDMAKNESSLTPETGKMLDAVSDKCIASMSKK